MKGTLRCPTCGGERIVHAERVLDRDAGASSELALVQNWATRGMGTLEVFVCAACGWCEWWVCDVVQLVEQVVSGQHQHLRMFAASAARDGSPYR